MRFQKLISVHKFLQRNSFSGIVVKHRYNLYAREKVFLYFTGHA